MFRRWYIEMMRDGLMEYFANIDDDPNYPVAGFADALAQFPNASVIEWKQTVDAGIRR